MTKRFILVSLCKCHRSHLHLMTLTWITTVFMMFLTFFPLLNLVKFWSILMALLMSLLMSRLLMALMSYWCPGLLTLYNDMWLQITSMRTNEFGVIEIVNEIQNRFSFFLLILEIGFWLSNFNINILYILQLNNT